MAAFIPSTTRPLIPDPQCKLSAVYQAQGSYRSGKRVWKANLFGPEGGVSNLLTDISKNKLEALGRVKVEETEPSDESWRSSEQTSWKAKVTARVLSWIGIGAGGGQSSNVEYIADRVRYISYPSLEFLKSVKPKSPEGPGGLEVDEKGRTIIFVVVKLLVADRLRVQKKGAVEASGGLSIPETGNFEAGLDNNTSYLLHIKGSADAPVILKRYLVRMAWDKDMDLATLRGDNDLEDGLGAEDVESDVLEESDEDFPIIEEEGLLNVDVPDDFSIIEEGGLLSSDVAYFF